MQLNAIDEMLAKFCFHFDSPVEGVHGCYLSFDGADEVESCSAFPAGQLIRASQKLGCFPSRQKGTDQHNSIIQLCGKLKGFSLKPYADKYPTHHFCCRGMAMARGMSSILEAVPSAVLDSYRVHLKGQWKKGNPDPGFT